MKFKMKNKFRNILKNQKLRLLFGFLIVVLVIFGLFIFFSEPTKKVSVPAKPAFLNSFNGEVEVFRNDSWIRVNKKQELFLNEKIRTFEGSTRISLYGRANIDLESNTLIEIFSLIKSNLSIIQLNGTTHNSFSNNNEYSYMVETPNALAIVFGTTFDIFVETGRDILFVRSGEVLFNGENNSESFSKYDKGIATKKQVLRVVASFDEIKSIYDNNVKTVENLKKKRLSAIEENSFLLGVAEKTYGLTKEDIILKLEDIDKGYIDDTVLIEKAPFKKDELRKIKVINDNIKIYNADIVYIDEMFNYSFN